MRNQLFILFVVIQTAAFSQEKLLLNTDRDIYIGGEDVWITVTNLEPESNKRSNLSKVAYAELLNASNVPVVQEKLYLDNGQVSSIITLPDTISTGNYLLRVYTKWMTNFGAECYEYKVLSVVNPFALNSLPHVKTVISQKSFNKPQNNSIKGVESEYSKRQKVSFEVDVSGKNWNGMSVSVVKSCLMRNQGYLPHQWRIGSSNITKELPEFKGEIISGTISNIETGEPVINEKLLLGFVNDMPILKFATTDSIGQFMFDVQRFGDEEMVIQPYSTDTTKLNYQVTLNSNFSGDFLDSTLPQLEFDSTAVKQLNKAIINMQVGTIYASYNANLALADSIKKQNAFFGIPENTILIDKYIELPTVEDVIREIVPFVGLRKNKGQYEFRIYEDKSLYPKEGETIVFVDGVVVRDVTAILNMNASNLEKIEVINLNYYIQDEELGRLLLFYTRNGDMGDLEFDKRVFRQVHNGFLNSYQYSNPDYSHETVKDSRLADYRNVLLYQNFTNITSLDRVAIEFFTSDESSGYVIVINGINEHGKHETITKTFITK